MPVFETVGELTIVLGQDPDGAPREELGHATARVGEESRFGT